MLVATISTSLVSTAGLRFQDGHQRPRAAGRVDSIRAETGGGGDDVRERSGAAAFSNPTTSGSQSAESTIVPIGVLLLVGVTLYVIPRTSLLGAIYLAAYLGGAVATHVRIDDGYNFISPIVGGVLVWSALWLRDARIRALAPLRR